MPQREHPGVNVTDKSTPSLNIYFSESNWNIFRDDCEATS